MSEPVKFDVALEEGSGPVVSIDLLGHHSDEEALSLLGQILAERDEDDYHPDGHRLGMPFGHRAPVRTYRRKIPARGEYGIEWIRWSYSRKPGRGATAVTTIEMRLSPPMPPCRECGAESSMGIPNSIALNDWPWLEGDDRKALLYVCPTHAIAYSQQYRVECKERAEAYAKGSDSE